MTNTINYDRPVKNLIDEHNQSGHVTHKSYKKKSVTLHHNGGRRLSHEAILRIWKTRPASAHFDVDAEGDIAQYVKANEYAWATGSTQGNIESISIEMANLSLGPNWLVGETTWRSAARLAGWIFANVIRERPNSGNFFVHNHWKSTICAGPTVKKLWPQIMAAAQAAYDEFSGRPTNPSPRPTPKPAPPSTRKSLTQVAAEVWAGKWGTGSDRAKKLRDAGYDPSVVQSLVNRGVGKTHAPAPPRKTKSVSDLASEVIRGEWGNGRDREIRLRAAGYNANAVQAEVNRRLR